MRAHELTAAILAPPLAPIGHGDRQLVRHNLTNAIPAMVENLPLGDQVVVTLAMLRQVARDPAALSRPEEPFAWKPAFVRRSLGLSAMDACINHRFSSPTEAVGPIADQAVSEWSRTGWRTFHWEPWIAALHPAARSAVMAEAATWATTLWSSIDWHRFDSPLGLGGPDDQWVCTAARTVRLKGRSELQVPLEATHGGGAESTALVSVAAGIPRTGWETELGFLALVASLRSPTRPVPSRVVGLWPDAGQYRSVDITSGVLTAAGDRVIACIGAVVDARMSMVV